MGIALALPAGAAAHATLLHSSPADRGVVPTAPREVRFVFDDKVRVASGIRAIRNAGGQFRTYPALPRAPHYQTLNPTPAPKWNSFPPTSGRHYYQPLIFGIYTEPVPEIRAVHNLEHGAVILQYGDKVSKAGVAKITAWYRQDANAVLVAPLPKLGDKVALTAWTRWAETTGFNEKVANDFRRAFRYKAPEHYPKSYLNPGE